MSRKVQQVQRLRHSEPDAKLRALARDMRRRPQKRERSLFGMVAGPIAAILISGIAVAWEQGSLASATSQFGLISGCNIKGNMSIETGERIYHVPGQTYYEATRISPEYGERWFCSEEEARRAGWRKSRT